MKTITSLFSVAISVGLLAVCGCSSTKPVCKKVCCKERSGPKAVLVENGVSRAPIVVFKDAPPYTRQAADELAGYIEKISGARPEVIDGEPDPVPEHAIWVGVQPTVRRLFPEIDFDFKYPEEILIAANGKHVVIAGRDRWDPDRLVVPTHRATINGKQFEYGTVNAVYTFLQDCLGVRWLWPGELGEDILSQKTIALPQCERRYHPQIRQRGELFRLSALGDNRGISFDWTRLQRLQLDSLTLQAGHAFGDWWNKYHVDHPEYFALQPDGTRSGFPEPGKVKMCQANPALWTQWLANVEETLQTHPDQICFSASPNDSWNRGHCVCERCRAWDHPDGAPVIYTWQGLSQEYVSLSDRQVTFANTLARLLKQRFPDRNLYVGMHAYGGSYTRPPIAVVPDDNVVISVVACFFQRRFTGRASNRAASDEQRAHFEGWGKLSTNLVWRPNTGNAAGWQQGLPDVAITQTMKDLRFVAENHCIGLYFDTIWENWPNQGPLYYLMAQMAWNPYADGEAIMDDYYRRGFGAAAPELKAYWTMMENARNRKEDEKLDYLQVYDKAFFEQAYRLLEKADSKLADAPERYGKRVAFVRKGLDFARLMNDTRALTAQWRASEETDKAAAEKARSNWTEMEQIATANLMNFKFFKPGSRYSKGLHPDYK